MAPRTIDIFLDRDRRIDFMSWDDIEANPFFVADASRVPELETYMDKLRKSGESVGARLTVVASGVPSGWGEPIYDRLDADIAKVMMGINAVKGVEIGAGFRSVEQLGTEHSDEMTPEGFLSNNAGGILGGVRRGRTLLCRLPSSPRQAFGCRGARSISRAIPRQLRRTGDTIAVWGFGRRRLLRRFWRWC